MRKLRRSLSSTDRDRLSQKICKRAAMLSEISRASSIALYLPFADEVDTSLLIRRLRSRGKSICLPVASKQGLKFFEWPEDAKLVAGIFGNPEPDQVSATPVSARYLDIVFAPLVAFDRTGTRIGMGGGYYDRAFAFLNRRSSWYKPMLVGLSFAFQEAKKLYRNDWDVPLSAAITDEETIRFSRR